MEKLFVYSGTSRFCECGLPTTILDDSEEELRTGDIVMGYVVDQFGVSAFDSLTVIVQQQYQSYADGTHELVEKEEAPFAMGLKKAELNVDYEEVEHPESAWRVRRVKKFEDVIPGENWEAFKFNYKKEKE